MRVYEITSTVVPSVLSKKINVSLMHLSFDGQLEGKWAPQTPTGEGEQTSLREPDWPRISVAPTVEDCFRAIYPNVSHYFEEENYPHMDFCVYVPQFAGTERVVKPSALTKYGFVHDAHVTHEYCILDPVYMRLDKRIRVFNTNDSPDLMYKPFGDGKERFLAPAEVNWEEI